MGLIEFIECLNRIKGCIRKKFFLSACLWLGHRFLPSGSYLDLDWNLHSQFSWFSSLWTQTGRNDNCTSSFPRSLACQLQILKFLSLHSHVSQFFIKSISISICFHPIVSISLENPNTIDSVLTWSSIGVLSQWSTKLALCGLLRIIVRWVLLVLFCRIRKRRLWGPAMG